MAVLTDKQQDRRQLFLSWNIETELPLEIETFHLERMDLQEERIYYAFAYKDSVTGWEVRILFDEETQDYMVKLYFRLFTITEIELINSNYERFKEDVVQLLPSIIKNRFFDRSKVSVLIGQNSFISWDYCKVMPLEIDEYKLTISPDKPILGLNGSYVIAAYECIEKNTGILFFYNMYRNEYYAELISHGILGIVHQYDSRTINELEKNIQIYIYDDLEKLKTTMIEV